MVLEFAHGGSDSGSAKQIALNMTAALREEITRRHDLKLSPHDWQDVQRIHEEVKRQPSHNFGKSMVVADYGVDLIVRGAVEVTS